MASSVFATALLFASCILVWLVPAISSAEAGRTRRAPAEVQTNRQSPCPTQCGSTCTCTGHPAPRSCLDILKSGASTGDGFYFLSQPDGTKYRAYCDMTLEGGGWTMFSTKASVQGRYIVDTFNPDSAQATHYDSAGCVPTNDWDEIMFRFAHDHGASRVVYSRHHGGAAAGQGAFDDGMRCSRPTTREISAVGGFYRHSPHIRHGQRDPPSNFHTIPSFVNGAGDSDQISEAHASDANWIAMWSGGAGGSNYISVDDQTARGRKCVAGSCFVDQPIWIMYR